MRDLLDYYHIAIVIDNYMIQLKGLFQKQIQLLLSNKQYALMYALMFALFPYTVWLSVVIIALITLRKGFGNGALVLLPVITLHLGYSLVSISVIPAVINTLTLFVPCYIAACALRLTTSWQAVAAVFFIIISLCAILVQTFAPQFVMAQYLYLQTILKETQSDSTVSRLLSDSTGMNQTILASYAFGIQMLSIIFSALSALFMARSIQSRLYKPGGFKIEMQTFRAHKISLLITAILFTTALQNNVVAMMVLPASVLYFLLAGLSFSMNALVHKNSRLVFIILVMPLIFIPFIMVPVYGMLGLLDSLFNLRIYTFKTRKRG